MKAPPRLLRRELCAELRDLFPKGDNFLLGLRGLDLGRQLRLTFKLAPATKGHHLFPDGRVNRTRRLKVPPRGAHFDGNREALKHLVRVWPNHMEPHHRLLRATED